MSFTSPGGGGDGSYTLPGGASAVFTDLYLTVQLVADALTTPSDTPTTDTTRLVRDAAGRRVLWSYSVDAASWKGVEQA